MLVSQRPLAVIKKTHTNRDKVPHTKDIEIVQNYRLIRPIAQGGMGTVYEAEMTGAGKFAKRVAVKIIREEFSTIPEFRSNFVGEARLVANLIHSNIVQIYYLGEKHGQYFMIMEYVDGYTLDEFILQHQALGKIIPEKIACFIISRVARGLAHAHQAKDVHGNKLGIVHRDVNPRNIIIGKNGDVKLMDFGIAKAAQFMYSREGQIIAGKDEYLSPEQALKQITDLRADLFSCGVILLEMLLGKNFFLADTGKKTRERIVHSDIPKLSESPYNINQDISQILESLLKKDRETRTQTAQLTMSALEYYLYKNGYGPTHEKLAKYLNDLFSEGILFEDEPTIISENFGINTPESHTATDLKG